MIRWSLIACWAPPWPPFEAVDVVDTPPPLPPSAPLVELAELAEETTPCGEGVGGAFCISPDDETPQPCLIGIEPAGKLVFESPSRTLQFWPVLGAWNPALMAVAAPLAASTPPSPAPP